MAFEPIDAVLTATLARIDILRARYVEHAQQAAILPNTLEALRVELTYHSNALEGNTLTLRETQTVLESLAPVGGKPLREIDEARNHDQALRLIEEWVRERPAATPLTERDLLALHAVMLANIDVAAAGRYRSERVLIAGTGFAPPGSQRFEALIAVLLEPARRPGPHPVIQAAELHYNLVAVHPIRDGNGRTARLLMNYHLLSRGFPHTLIEIGQRAEYLAALDEANEGRWQRFAVLVAGCVERSFERLG